MKLIQNYYPNQLGEDSPGSSTVTLLSFITVIMDVWGHISTLLSVHYL